MTKREELMNRILNKQLSTDCLGSEDLKTLGLDLDTFLRVGKISNEEYLDDMKRYHEAYRIWRDLRLERLSEHGLPLDKSRFSSIKPLFSLVSDEHGMVQERFSTYEDIVQEAMNWMHNELFDGMDPNGLRDLFASMMYCLSDGNVVDYDNTRSYYFEEN